MFQRSRKDLRTAVIACVVAGVVAAAPAVAGRVVDYARNAGKVGGMRPSELSRVSLGRRHSHVDDFASSGWNTVHGAPVHAPARGIVLAWGQFSAEWDDDSDPGSYATLAVRLTVDDKVAGQPQVVEIDRATRGGARPIVLTGAVPVPAGPHRVRIQVRRRDGSALSHLFPRQTETLFVPFGDSGEQAKL